MQKRFAAVQEEDYWFVIDTSLREDSNLVYESLATEFEARTIAEILNDNEEDMTFEQICGDWRWMVLEQIEELATNVSIIYAS